MGLPRNSDGKEYACSAGDLCPIPGSGRSLGEGNGNSLRNSLVENSTDRGAWWATVHGVAKSLTWLSDWYFHFQGTEHGWPTRCWPRDALRRPGAPPSAPVLGGVWCSRFQNSRTVWIGWVPDKGEGEARPSSFPLRLMPALGEPCDWLG